MRTNLLKFNDSKTEFMMLGTKRNLEKAEACTTSIKTRNDEIKNVTSVRDLGFHLDNELKSGVHVNMLTSTLFIPIKRIANIQHLIDEEKMKIMMQALVHSMLDYCNS